jgi:hypothetical protein
MKDYILHGFRKSQRHGKKYDAILINNRRGNYIYIPFGSLFYQNYDDKTGLNLYNNLLHYDKNRRRLYRIRHMKDLKKGYYSAGYFSFFYLW